MIGYSFLLRSTLAVLQKTVAVDACYRIKFLIKRTRLGRNVFAYLF